MLCAEVPAEPPLLDLLAVQLDQAFVDDAVQGADLQPHPGAGQLVNLAHDFVAATKAAPRRRPELTLPMSGSSYLETMGTLRCR